MLEDLIKLLLAAVFGGLVGIERQMGGQNAGFRTQLLVCLGSCLFTLTSFHVYETFGKPADPARIAAQVVVGIGFLGAGAILRFGGNYIRGLTTAASLWIVSAIGMAVGFGNYMVASFTTLLVLANLAILKNFEDMLPKTRYSSLIIRTRGPQEIHISAVAKDLDMKIVETKYKFMKEHNLVEHEVSVRYKKYDQLTDLIEALKAIPNLLELHIS